MATTISVQVGSLTGAVTYQDDTKTAEILRHYYTYMQLGPSDAAPQAMLNAIAASVAGEIARYAVQHYIDLRSAELEQQLRDEAAAAVTFIGTIQ